MTHEIPPPPDINIEIDPEVSLADVRGKPFTLVCELAIGAGGQPVLRSRHAYRLKRNPDPNQRGFLLERVDP